MFSTFASEPAGDSSGPAEPTASAACSAQPRKKRTQVARACEWCRVHRIKCDNDQPCSNCRRRGRPCSNEGVNPLQTLPQAYREIENLRMKVEELERELQKERARAAPQDAYAHHQQQLQTPPSQPATQSPEGDHEQQSEPDHGFPQRSQKRFWEGIQISTARSAQKTWFGPASLFFFVGRLNTFLDLALQQRQPANRMLPDSASKLLDGPTTLPAGERGPRSGGAGTADVLNVDKYLSPTQEEYFLGLFWQSYHTAYPILDEVEFKEHYSSLWTSSEKARRPSALVDIVIALCMQFGMALLPNARREISAASRAIVDKNDATISGRWHYERCQSLMATDLESPTLAILQCHILCSIYLCCGSFQNMSDNACAQAVRTAYMLGLHIDPPDTMPQRERELRRRIWWVLYALESKMSMKLGRPFLTHSCATTCSLPDDHHETAMLSGSSFVPLGENVTWLTWNIHNTKLMLAARAAHSALYDKDPNSFSVPCTTENIWQDSRMLEAYAEFMQPHMRHLANWARCVPDVFKTKRQNGIPLSTDRSPLEIEQFSPLWLQRQRLLLELMFHNLTMTLYRPFVSFVPAATPTPLADISAMKCAEHGMALTHIMYQVICTTSILAGWHEAFQWQWNAAVTLIGFVLANPLSALTQAARDAIDLSVVVFETFGNSFAIAASAANITRELSAKVDLLIERSRLSSSVAGSAEQQTQLPAEGIPPVPIPTDPGQCTERDLIADFNPTTQAVDGLYNFDGDAVAAMQRYLNQSINAMMGVEMYNSFDADFENLMTNANTNDQWAFQG